MFSLKKTLKGFSKNLFFLITIHFNQKGKEIYKPTCVLFGLSIISFKNLSLEFTSNKDPFLNTNMHNLAYEKHFNDITKSILVKNNVNL